MLFGENEPELSFSHFRSVRFRESGTLQSSSRLISLGALPNNISPRIFIQLFFFYYCPFLSRKLQAIFVKLLFLHFVSFSQQSTSYIFQSQTTKSRHLLYHSEFLFLLSFGKKWRRCSWREME